MQAPAYADSLTRCIASGCRVEFGGTRFLNAIKSQRPRNARTASRRTGSRPAPKKRRHLGWIGRVVLACAAVVLGLIAWGAAERALAPTENTSQTNFDAVIVLGAPVDDDGNPSPRELARVTEAVHEYEQGVASHVIVTGGAVKNRFVEAKAMGRVAEAQGIPASAVFEDSKARSTVENTCDALRIMRRHGWESAEVISSAYHLPRAGLILSRLPMKWRVHAAPALGIASRGTTVYQNALETLKTVYYLVWTRQEEPCELGGSTPLATIE